MGYAKLGSRKLGKVANKVDDVSRDVVMGFMKGEEQPNILGQEIHKGGNLEAVGALNSRDGSK